MSGPPTATDWTRGWKDARALLLVSRARRPGALADPAAARLLELALELVVLRHRLTHRAHVILPGTFAVIGARPGAGHPQRLPWPAAVGRAKGAFARWWNRRGGVAGSVGEEATVIRPLETEAEVLRAIHRLHQAPVRAGLARTPADHPWSSWHDVHGGRVSGFGVPWEAS